MAQATKKSKRSKAGTATDLWAASYFFDDVLAFAKTLANRKKEWSAEKISEFAEATRDFAMSVEALPNLANFVNPTVESLEEFAEYVRETEFEQIVRDTSTFARRHPIFTIAGGVMAGLIATQALRSSGIVPKAARATKSTRQSGTAKTIRKAIASKSKKLNGHAHLNM